MGTAVIEERSRAGTVGLVRYRFTHAFFRQTLYEELIAPRHIRLHQQVARALEALHGSRLSEHASDLADHFSYSSDATDLVKAVQYGERAAERAAAVHDYGEAAQLLDRAIAAQGVLDPGDKEKLCDLGLVLATTLLSADEPSRVDSVAEEAFALAEAIGDSNRAADASVAALEAMGRVDGVPGVVSDRGQEWLARADHHAGAGSAARVWADLTRYTVERDQKLLDRALDSARHGEDADAFHRAASLAMSPVGRQSESTRRELAAEVQARSGDGVSVRARATSLSSAYTTFLELGDRASAEPLMSTVIDLPLKAPESIAVSHSIVAQIETATMDGHFRQAVDTAHSLPGDTGLINVRIAIARPLTYLGRVDEFMAEWEPRMIGSFNLIANIYALAGDHVTATERMQERAEEPPFLSGDVHALEAAIVLLNRDAVRTFAERILHEPRTATTGAFWLLIPDRHLGDGFSYLGEPSRARKHYDAALEIAERMRFRPEVALTRLGLAELLIGHYPDELDGPFDHMEFVLREFQEMDMRPPPSTRRCGLSSNSRESPPLTPRHPSTPLPPPFRATTRTLPGRLPQDGTVTLLFSDIIDSTATNERLGDAAWMELLREHNGIVRGCVAQHGGYEVKSMGDGFMLAFKSARDGLNCAIAIQRGIRTRNGSADETVEVRIGLHTGEAVQEQGDFFGKHVNLAARIGGSASGGEILVSVLLAQLVGPSGEFRLSERAAMALKGLDGEHVVGWK